MRRVRALLLRLAGLFRKDRRDHDLAAEMDSHLQMHIEDNLRAGMSAVEARRQALIKLGGVEQTKEIYRDRRGLPLLDTLVQDARYAFRMLRKNPGFTSVAIVTLALGIGANTAIFSVVNAVLLSPLPFKDSQHLVMVWNRGPEAAGGDRTPLSVADVLDWRAQARSFTDIGAYQNTSFNCVGGGSPEWIRGANVTANFFSLLGVPPELGRNFLPDDDHPGAQHVAILSDGFWRRRFAGDPNVAGRAINLDGVTHTIIGVIPPHIDFPTKDVVVWTTLQLQTPTRRGPYFLNGIARLKDDVSPQAARAELNSIKTSFPSGQHVLNGQQLTLNMVGVNEFVVGDVRLALLVLLTAVTLVLLIAAVNVANLMLVRSAARVKEMSLRAAFGASRSRVIRQLLTESVLLALAGGVIGIFLAAAGVRLLLRLALDTIPHVTQVGIDGRVLAWTALVSLLTGVFFGLAPAWQSSRLTLDEALKESGRATTDSSGKRRWGGLLVVTELAVAVTLLISAGLLVKSLWRLQSVDSGVITGQILTIQLPLRGPNYAKTQQLDIFYPRLLERIQSLPGVRAAAVSNSLPPDSTEYSDDFTIAGRPPDPNLPPPIAYMIIVSPDYFRTFGIPLRRGRLFSASDSPDRQHVAIISETTARQFFPHEDPIGKSIDEKGTIVGIVADVKYTGLAEPTQPAIYMPLAQAHSWDVLLSVKTDSADPTRLSSAVRSELSSLDPELPLSKVSTLDSRFAAAVAQPRFRTTLIALFAGLAFVLAVVGTYGVVSYSVTRRTHEIGIRMALGAQAGTVLKLVLMQGALLAVAGVSLGLLGSFALTGLLRNLLFNVSATDWSTFGSIAILLAGTALLACWIPARRAMRVDPIIALRYE